jgi:hypothetical protein
MSTKTLTRYDHPAAWIASELKAQSDKWVYQLTEEDLAELDAAFQQVKSKRLIVPNFGKDEFPMPKLAARLEEYIRELESGVGILNIVGFLIEKYTKDETSAISALNNHYLLHARSDYVDYDEPSEKRHLRRLWLESKAWGDARPPAMATILDKVRKHWNTGAGVEMWDNE